MNLLTFIACSVLVSSLYPFFLPTCLLAFLLASSLSLGQVGVVQSAVKRPTSAAANVLSFVLISARGGARARSGARRGFATFVCV